MPEFSFTCNICEQQGILPQAHDYDSDVPSCARCKSNARFRWLIHRLSLELFDSSIPLPKFPRRKSIKGLGLTDPEVISRILAKRFSYRNTHFTSAPKFDICTDDSPVGPLDFLIASEVFEHVEPPVDRAFANAARILKDSGFLLLTTPWVFDGPEESAIGELHDWAIRESKRGPEIINRKPDGDVEHIGDLSPDGTPGRSFRYTREHFPHLHQWRLLEENGAWRLINKRRDRTTEEFHNLTFHEGPGVALEMRLFTRSGIEENLKAAGFHHFEFESQDCPEYGIIFGCEWSRPIIARKQPKAKPERRWSRIRLPWQRPGPGTRD